MKPLRIFSHVACDSPGYLGNYLEKNTYDYELICIDDGVTVPNDIDHLAGLVFLGGAGDINEPTDWMLKEQELLEQALKQGLPVMGVCLGAQMLSKALGGVVRPNRSLEVGWHPVVNLSAQDWFAGLPSTFEVFQWHAHTFSLPPGAAALARNDCAELQAFSFGKSVAMQFHLEMTPAMIEGLIERYTSDLEGNSSCIQDVSEITSDLQLRAEELHRVADKIYSHWLSVVYDT